MIKNTKSAAGFSEDDLNQYDALFIPGGHGIMFDGPENPALKKIIEHMWKQGKIVSAVCHGPAGLLSPVDPSSGESILKGKRACGFTNSEEKAVGKSDVVPFSLEDKMKELGAEFECGPDWSEYVVVDEENGKKLITGQNPQSSRAVAEAVAAAILPGLLPQHEGKAEGEGFKARGHPVTGEHHAHGDDKVPPHPQAHMHQWQSPVRQTTHTGPGSACIYRAARSGRPDKSYVG
jgi:putative intracellular protease/amidase